MKTKEKLFKARQTIREMDVKKKGRNTYSNYDYFTPEQISGMVAKVNNELELFTQFNLVRTELGLMARLSISDLKTEGDVLTFEIATEIPEIKATNVAQQLGGCVTYSERYLLMIAYDIKDNALDFDSQDNRKKPETKNPEPKTVKKEELTPDHPGWEKAIKFIVDGGTLAKIKDKYVISETNSQDLLFAAEINSK